MANDGWSAVKGLRAIGVDAELIVHRPAHVASLPQWEEAEIDITRLGNDLNDPDWDVLNEKWTMPDYVHVWDMYPRKSHPSTLILSILKSIRRITELGSYDIIIGHAPFGTLAPLYNILHHRSYIVYDAGWIRYLHHYNFYWYRMARIGYRKARRIFFTNVDTYNMFIANGYPPEQLVYTPFAIDMDLYAPQNVKDTYHKHPIFFSPSRQDWLEKGNERLLYAFQAYLKRQPNALLLLVEWGQVGLFTEESYVVKAKRLIGELGIRDSVKWLPVMPKRDLVKYYNMADVVFDQFILGALGTTAPEAMSCGKPVVSYVDPEMWKRWHGSVPPVANARSIEEIYQQMVNLEDTSLRAEYGRRAHKWISENLEMKVVAKRQLKVCEEIVRR